MPQWIIRRGKYFSRCHGCNREVEGVEEPGGGPNGRRDTVIFFRCGCGARWHKKKHVFLDAVRGGYENGLGEWIECDEAGHIKPEVRAKMHNDILGYGAVQVAKHIYFERGLQPADDVDEKFKIALRALQEGKNDEEARKIVASYIRSHMK